MIKGTKEYQDKGTYKLSPGLRRGKAMIINFDTFEGTDYAPREGSQKDVSTMRTLLSQLGKYSNSNFKRLCPCVCLSVMSSHLIISEIFKYPSQGSRQ